MSSEADLDTDIKTLSILSEHPELYSEFAKLGCVASLASLLSHENTDIAIDAIEIINELTDEDVSAEQSQWDTLVDTLLEADLLPLLHSNLSRMNESLESDRAGVYHILSVLENLSSRPSIVSNVGQITDFVPWLLSRVRAPEPTVSQNKQYAAEILAIFLQSSSSNRAQFISLDGIDVALQLLSPYRKRDPAKGTEEEEYLENIFDCLTCTVEDRDGKTKFLEAEGIELCLIMLREGKMSKPRAVRLLDHALGRMDGGLCCERLVQAAGLKPVFGLLAKKIDSEATEHVLGILASMLRSLPANGSERIRLLAKCEEKGWRVVGTLVALRREVGSKVASVEKEIQAEKNGLGAEDAEERADEWLSRRLDAGLYVLQTVDVILAWLVAEDERAKKVVTEALADRDEGLVDVRRTLQGRFYPTQWNDGTVADDEDRAAGQHECKPRGGGPSAEGYDRYTDPIPPIIIRHLNTATSVPRSHPPSPIISTTPPPPLLQPPPSPPLIPNHIHPPLHPHRPRPLPPTLNLPLQLHPQNPFPIPPPPRPRNLRPRLRHPHNQTAPLPPNRVGGNTLLPPRGHPILLHKAHQLLSLPSKRLHRRFSRLGSLQERCDQA